MKGEMWRLTILDRKGGFVENRIGWVDTIEYYDVEEDGLRSLEFSAEDILLDDHDALKGLKNKTVDVECPLDDGTTCSFVGKVTEVDRENGTVVIKETKPPNSA